MSPRERKSSSSSSTSTSAPYTNGHDRSTINASVCRDSGRTEREREGEIVIGANDAVCRDGKWEAVSISAFVAKEEGRLAGSDLS